MTRATALPPILQSRAPGPVTVLSALQPTPGTIRLIWENPAGADTYTVTRGELGQIETGSYGSCLASGLPLPDFEDPALPDPGEGYFYLIQAESQACGLGALGFDSEGTQRVNGNSSACR